MSLNNLICKAFNKKEVTVGDILSGGLYAIIGLGIIYSLIMGAVLLLSGDLFKSDIESWESMGAIEFLTSYRGLAGIAGAAVLIIIIGVSVCHLLYHISKLKIAKCERKQEEK